MTLSVIKEPEDELHDYSGLYWSLDVITMEIVCLFQAISEPGYSAAYAQMAKCLVNVSSSCVFCTITLEFFDVHRDS